MPAIPKHQGGHGCLDATRDANRIEEWWRKYPNANVGIATGRASGLLVIDVDPTRDVANWLASLRALDLPRTFTVKTWSGGSHHYFLLPADSRITIGADLVPAIDWRGNGGYVVAAGSVVNGVLYQIVRNSPNREHREAGCDTGGKVRGGTEVTR